MAVTSLSRASFFNQENGIATISEKQMVKVNELQKAIDEFQWYKQAFHELEENALKSLDKKLLIEVVSEDSPIHQALVAGTFMTNIGSTDFLKENNPEVEYNVLYLVDIPNSPDEKYEVVYLKTADGKGKWSNLGSTKFTDEQILNIKNGLSGSIDNLTNAYNAFAERTDQTIGEIQTKDTEQDGEITNIKDDISNLESTKADKSEVASTYETKTDAQDKLNTAKEYTDTKVQTLSDEFTAHVETANQKFDEIQTKDSEQDDSISDINQSIQTITGCIEDLDTNKANKADVEATYETKTDAQDKLTAAKEYTDTKASQLSDDYNDKFVAVSEVITDLSDVYDAKGTAQSLADVLSNDYELSVGNLITKITNTKNELTTQIKGAKDTAKDYTDTEIEKLTAVYDEKGAAADALQDAKDYADREITKLSGAVDDSVADAVASLIDGAPEAFNTLKELADWISDEASGAAAIVNSIANCSDRVDALSTNKADLSAVQQIGSNVAQLATTVETQYYTKEQSDDRFQPVGNYANASDIQAVADDLQDLSGYVNGALINQVNGNSQAVQGITTALAGKANASDVYTKTEADERFLQEHQDITGKADLSSVYTKAQADEIFATKTYVDGEFEKYVKASDIKTALDPIANFNPYDGEETIAEKLTTIATVLSNLLTLVS